MPPAAGPDSSQANVPNGGNIVPLRGTPSGKITPGLFAFGENVDVGRACVGGIQGADANKPEFRPGTGNRPTTMPPGSPGSGRTAAPLPLSDGVLIQTGVPVTSTARSFNDPVHRKRRPAFALGTSDNGKRARTEGRSVRMYWILPQGQRPVSFAHWALRSQSKKTGKDYRIRVEPPPVRGTVRIGYSTIVMRPSV